MTAILTATPTERDPRISLSITFQRTTPGLPSVPDVASVMGSITQLFEAGRHPTRFGARAKSGPTDRAHSGPICSLASLSLRASP
jgi:hypothetical protein